jgi:N-acetylneuraminic acid mutarotase
MAYDPESGNLFMFGGVKRYDNFKDVPEVWAFEPATNRWHEQGKLGPKAVSSAVLDEESKKIIVFGWVYDGKQGATWAYDPATDTWQQMNPAMAPSTRYGSLMAYDIESDRVVLFGGGLSPTNCWDDTWVYDYNTDTWTEMHPEVSPPERGFHGMVYVPEYDLVLLWGGTTEADTPDLRVWAYDYESNTWTTQEAPSDAPEQRAGMGLVYHPPSRRMILFGGLTELDGQMAAETTWAYDYGANSWEALDLPENPGVRAFFPMAYAPSVDKAILFGGELEDKWANVTSDEVWSFDPSTGQWEKVARP